MTLLRVVWISRMEIYSYTLTKGIENDCYLII